MNNGNLNLLAEGLWARLRDILLAQSRWDGFVHDPEGGSPEPLPPPEESGRLASEMVLRALRVGVDPVNQTILRHLAQEEKVALTSLMEHTGLSRVAVIETINDLSQVGLASYAVETQEVHATSGTTGLVELLEEVSARLAQLLRDSSIQNPKSKIQNQQ